jgi:threonine dehydrogenase-like Zn-dependent dehydrogenase
MAQAGEAVVVDGLGTRVQQPRSWANQKALYDAKRHTHTAQGLAVSTIWGDLLWCDKPATLHLESLWIRNVTITTGLVDTFSTPTLLRAVAAGQLDPTRFTTHRFPLGAAMDAYDTFARADQTNALKVLMTAQG